MYDISVCQIWYTKKFSKLQWWIQNFLKACSASYAVLTKACNWCCSYPWLQQCYSEFKKKIVNKISFDEKNVFSCCWNLLNLAPQFKLCVSIYLVAMLESKKIEKKKAQKKSCRTRYWDFWLGCYHFLASDL